MPCLLHDWRQVDDLNTTTSSAQKQGIEVPRRWCEVVCMPTRMTLSEICVRRADRTSDHCHCIEATVVGSTKYVHRAHGPAEPRTLTQLTGRSNTRSGLDPHRVQCISIQQAVLLKAVLSEEVASLRQRVTSELSLSPQRRVIFTQSEMHTVECDQRDARSLETGWSKSLQIPMQISVLTAASGSRERRSDRVSSRHKTSSQTLATEGEPRENKYELQVRVQMSPSSQKRG